VPHSRGARSKPLNFTEPSPWPPGKAPAKAYCSEGERLAVLASFDPDALVGDTELARIARFAAQLCGAQSAAISLVEAERQRFIAGEGLTASETPRTTSFCAQTMLGADLLEVLDASGDPRFADFALVRGETHLRYYVGAPLISAEGAPLGALCITDTVPRKAPLDLLQREGLLVLAEAVMRRLHAHRQASAAESELQASARRLQFLLDSVPDIAWSAAPGPVFDYFNARFSEVTGVPPPKSVEDWRDIIHPDDFDASQMKLAQAMTTATLFEDEWRLRIADGSYRYVLSRAVPSSGDSASARWFGTITDIDDAHRISQERDLLAGELAHRIKNIFSVITGLISLHARGDASLKAFAETLNENIRALARAQEFALRIDNESNEDLKGLLGVLMAPYGMPGAGAVAIAGDEVPIGVRAATPLALVFHELGTNSAKYGALSAAGGRVAIAVSRASDQVRIAWRECGGPPATAPQTTGFGSRLVTMAIEHQLGGTIAQDWRSEGLACDIVIPAARLG
jgi:PAS domain S-box-containing protein